MPLQGDQVGLPYHASYYPCKYPRTRHTLSKAGTAYALWPRERIAALEARESGSFATQPLLLDMRRLRLNVQTSMAGQVSVEVAESQRYGGGGAALPGRSFSDCDTIVTDSLDHIVKWNGESDLGYAPGQAITLRFRMRAAKLFAFEIM